MICLVLIGFRDTVIQRYGGKKIPINPISLDYSEVIYLDTRTTANGNDFDERQKRVKLATRYIERVSKSCYLADVDCSKLPPELTNYLKGYQRN